MIDKTSVSKEKEKESRFSGEHSTPPLSNGSCTIEEEGEGSCIVIAGWKLQSSIFEEQPRWEKRRIAKLSFLGFFFLMF